MIQFVHPSIEEYRSRAPRPERREGGSRCTGTRRKSEPDLPLVTVVTSVFNSGPYFERAIDSVLEQTYPNVEYVFADGGSKDDTVEVIQRYGDRIDYWVSERDQSMFDGMNRGIAAASGELIKIHGADDVMPPDSVELAVAAYKRVQAEADSVVIRGDMEIVDLEERPIVVAGLDQSLAYSPPILHPTWYVPVATYERWGLYDPNTVVSSDYEMYFYLAQNGVRFEHVDAPLSRFRTGGTSSTYAGLTDGFMINRHYQGLVAASYVAAMAALRVSGRRVLARTIGQRRTNDLRRTVKQLLANRQ